LKEEEVIITLEKDFSPADSILGASGLHISLTSADSCCTV
jgi:hypothetical protein